MSLRPIRVEKRSQANRPRTVVRGHRSKVTTTGLWSLRPTRCGSSITSEETTFLGKRLAGEDVVVHPREITLSMAERTWAIDAESSLAIDQPEILKPLEENAMRAISLPCVHLHRSIEVAAENQLRLTTLPEFAMKEMGEIAEHSMKSGNRVLVLIQLSVHADQDQFRSVR